MGQKVNPHGLRVGIIKDWDSRWYAEDAFADNLVEDDKIRKYVKKRLYNAGISKIEIERASDRVKLIVYTAKPGVVIGKSSLLSTMIMFGIIQGLYIVREDEEAEEEHQIEMQRARQRNRSRQNERRRQSSSNAKSGRSRQDGRDRRREYDGDNRDRARQRERDLRNESGRTTGKKTTKSRPRFEDVPEQRQQRQRRTRSEQRVR